MKQDLTPNGVAAKLIEIYAMTDPNRLAEATAVETNFKNWLGDNFNLTTDQSTFLSGINASASTEFGKNSGIAFRNKLPIALSPGTPYDHARKWVQMTNNIITSTNSSGDLEYTGSLLFEYKYIL